MGRRAVGLAAVGALLVLAAPAHATVWRPPPGTTWQWQITGRIDPAALDVEMFDLDLQDAVPAGTDIHVTGFGTVHWPKGVNAGAIADLHAGGTTVICYLDSGAWESYRPDADLFPRAVIGAKTYASNGDPWVGERWLDIRHRNWPRFAPLIWARIDLAAQVGCDGVEPDENNPLGNQPGFPVTKAIEKRWYLRVAQAAHARGLSVGMKNGVEVIDADTVAAFDWSLNEECFQYHECGTEQPFLDAGKAVFQVEYVGDPGDFCPKALARGLSSMKKHLELGAWRIAC